MTTINYIRVSTAEQNSERQLIGVACDKVFEDIASGKDTNRNGLNAMLDYAREGDTINIHELSRLGRNVEDLLQIVKSLNAKGVAVNFVKESLLFNGDSNAVQDLMLHMLSAISQFERSLLLERQREGIAIARAAGKYKGRVSRFSAREVDTMTKAFAASTNKAELAREYGISRAYLYRLVSQPA